MALGELLQLAPEIVVNKYLAITSIDSGTVKLSELQETAGWRSINGIAYSPRIISAQDLPHEGFDEWHIFDEAKNLGSIFTGNPFEAELVQNELVVMVNTMAFNLHDRLTGLPDMFWQQLRWILPESYVADGSHCLSFATRDVDLFHRVCAALEVA